MHPTQDNTNNSDNAVPNRPARDAAAAQADQQLKTTSS